MSTHDVLAYAVATEAVRRLRTGAAPWSAIFSPDAYVTASRAWPVPDFVILDTTNGLSVAAEFKPPQQSKREYLTGLGQALAYSRDFHYSLLVVPDVAEDGYPIADHIVSVLKQPVLIAAPVALLSYDPAIFSPHSPAFSEAHFFAARAVAPTRLAALDTSFYAKWREMGPQEIQLLLAHSYDEMRSTAAPGANIRDRAFNRLWTEIQSGHVHHWGGGVRHYANTPTQKAGVAKNYRNFLFHIAWTEADGALTKAGLDALHVATMYGHASRPFADAIASAVLMEGKHLILFNAISEYQDGLPQPFPSEETWLAGLETFLENKGLLKRNPARAGTVSARQFLKAEKQLWKNLELIIPRGQRVFHPGRGFIFNWARISDLLRA